MGDEQEKALIQISSEVAVQAASRWGAHHGKGGLKLKMAIHVTLKLHYISMKG